MEDTRVHALDYLTVFRRRRWWLAAPVIAALAVGAVLLKVLPKEFRSTATVGVEAPMVSPSIINQSPLDNQDRLRALQQELMSAPILARVAKEEGLGTDARAVDALRSRIKVTVPDPVAATNEPRRLDTFLVSYTGGAPARAQQITNRIANVFVDETSKARTEHAEDTSEFILQQQRASQTRLDALEAELRRANEAHMGQLPEQTQANLQTLSGLRQQLESNATALRGEQDRLTMVERQIDGMTKGTPEFAGLPPSQATTTLQPDARVMMLERQLAEARLNYTDVHPEVLMLKDQLTAARADAAAEKARPASDRVAQLQMDPAYRQLSTDRANSQLRVRELQAADTGLRRQINTYQARVEAAPMVEQQLAPLERDYELEKTQYNDLAGKLHAATIAESVERNRRGEQFTVLEGATYPTAPTTPIPWRVMLIALAAGLSLGAALTFAREYLDRSVHDLHDLKDEFELPVLGEVAHIQAV
ncbi:MAG TPA: Wzz/FepE/Etk N-terminal domain-containing protein [Vicinamibacterales bacterium]|jgi:polysaccharide chain length determinant protein (PEP-CTERM system associated)|nr:Wzz/FepE/Etk N-terminal domain-containing protein [Vicinamibacterales bacterium]